MIKLQNGSYHMGDHGDKQAVMDLLVAFTKEKGHEVTRQEVLDTPTMPHPNTIGSYVDGGFDAAVKKAHVLAFPKENTTTKETTTSSKQAPKKERTPLTREEILEKVVAACFQHGDNTGWINDISLRSVVPIGDVYKAFKQGGVKELRNAVKAALWEQKHPNKSPKEPTPLVQTVVVPDEVLKSVTEEPELPKEEEKPEVVQETEAVQPSEPTKEPDPQEEYIEADDFYSVEDIEDYEEATEEVTEPEVPAEPIKEPEETPEPEKAEEPVEVEKEAMPEEVIDVAKDKKQDKKRSIDTSKMSDQEIADMYYKVCKEKGYIMNQRESLEYSKHHPFPSWSTLVNRLGNWWGWGTRFNLPYKDEKANEKARQYMDSQGRQKYDAGPDEPDNNPGPGPMLDPDTNVIPEKEPEPEPQPEPEPATPILGTIPTNREFVYPIKITLPEGMSGTISFHMDLDVTIKI